MNGRGRLAGVGFWLPALLWLPAAVAAAAAIRLQGGPLAGAEAGPALWSLAPVTVCGLPLALACRRLWRLGHRGAAWAAGAVLGAATAAAALFAGLLGPLAIAAAAALASLPAWIAAFALGRRGRAGRPVSRNPPQDAGSAAAAGRVRSPPAEGRAPAGETGR